ADARGRLLKRDGVTIPSAIELWVAPVDVPEMWKRVTFWDTPVAGFDMTAGRSIALNTGYPVRLAVAELLGDAARLAAIDLSTATPERFGGEVSLTVEHDGTLHGVGGWFRAQLSPTVTMTNSPLDTERINRRQVYFPIGRPVAVRRGDRIKATLHIIAADHLV